MGEDSNGKKQVKPIPTTDWQIQPNRRVKNARAHPQCGFIVAERSRPRKVKCVQIFEPPFLSVYIFMETKTKQNPMQTYCCRDLSSYTLDIYILEPIKQADKRSVEKVVKSGVCVYELRVLYVCNKMNESGTCANEHGCSRLD